MPHVYCDCCHKVTAHKVVLKRCENSNISFLRSLVCFFATVLQGDHYVKMEKQYFCRGCNRQNEFSPASASMANIKTA
ncbi:hypothetical protein H2O73_03495 [Vibrio sp. 404]|uniref:Uncharacterized protein n=1 Tax=Vibrio marinisediminis TaxID=2758441 RepID=A0A7W2FNL6_9VIBR|nr:hypothetical protein [Vibrio marinisediminis]MBA5761399.1 hypothetical protein [Vibrio marinisediminis]